MRSKTGRTWLGLIPLLALAAFAIAPALAQGAIWEHCEKVPAGKGRYANNMCSKEGGEKDWEWAPIAEKVREEVKTHGTLELHMLGVRGVQPKRQRLCLERKHR
jgi:hypothetical protein